MAADLLLFYLHPKQPDYPYFGENVLLNFANKANQAD